jgi:hypothetical protein
MRYMGDAAHSGFIWLPGLTIAWPSAAHRDTNCILCDSVSLAGTDVPFAAKLKSSIVDSANH